jgi:ribosomal protein L11 methylase PrmA
MVCMVQIVLDVGCGTGLLSILCAQAGASKVMW